MPESGSISVCLGPAACSSGRGTLGHFLSPDVDMGSNNNSCLLPRGVVGNSSVSVGKTLKIPRIYFKLISLKNLLSVFNTQKRSLPAAEARFF